MREDGDAGLLQDAVAGQLRGLVGDVDVADGGDRVVTARAIVDTIIVRYDADAFAKFNEELPSTFLRYVRHVLARMHRVQ